MLYNEVKVSNLIDINPKACIRIIEGEEEII